MFNVAFVGKELKFKIIQQLLLGALCVVNKSTARTRADTIFQLFDCIYVKNIIFIHDFFSCFVLPKEI